MITRDEFKNHMQVLMGFESYLHKLAKLGVDISDRQEVMNIISSYRKSIEKEINCKWNPAFGTDISWWLYEVEDKNNDNYNWIKVDDVKYHIRNLDDLYDYLVM